MPAARAKFASENVGEQVLKARKSRGWTQADLAASLADLGFTGWRQTKVAKIEAGAVARVSLDDVLALAAALDVQLAHLLAPDGAGVAIAPKLALSPPDFRAWVRGHRPLSPEADRNYFFGPLVPEEEWREFVAGVGAAGRAIVGGGVSITTDTTPVEREASKQESERRRQRRRQLQKEMEGEDAR
jgi:transcriptional regulator with XRE-family HTH domain